MGIWIGKNRKARVAYGFDDVALVPGTKTINPLEVDTSFCIPSDKGADINFDVPIMASPMDGVTDVRFCTEMGRLGGLAVLNLDGVQTRYENPQRVIDQIVNNGDDHVTSVLQGIYTEPIKEQLIVKRIQDLKNAGVLVAVSLPPQKAQRYSKLITDSGADVMVVQNTVISSKHLSTQYQAYDISKICSETEIPVIVGNTVNYQVAFDLMEAGASGIIVGIGPGAACTSNQVLGLGTPQITATVDCASARYEFYKLHGKYIPIITDGGMKNGGDICKALAAGADAVMIGSAFAKATEAPGKGHHWGMVTPNANLPRGKRINVGISGSLKSILYGPSNVDDGSQNLIGALTICMGSVGAKDIKEFQTTEMVVTHNSQL